MPIGLKLKSQSSKFLQKKKLNLVIFQKKKRKKLKRMTEQTKKQKDLLPDKPKEEAKEVAKEELM